MSDAISPSNDHANLRAEALFYGAFDLPAGERREFLERACAGNAELRQEVEGMLHDHEAATDFMTGGTPFAANAVPAFPALSREKTGDWIGPYKLLEQLGEGGFGTVWVAEQEKPVRRRVALKIIKLGMDTKEVIARFEQERQALAMMDHPNIARVLDAGATPIGRPYFVMELVRGVKITKYCDQNNLPTAERLKLFIAVCHAVQHAHQKGIIHRDLKPSNILVTLHDGVPVPKVIDFGVAKATQQQRLTDLTIYTQFEQMVGTPLYMSPEQAEMSGLDIDTRSDIYSLGVLLYELLAGRTPFDPETLMKRGLDEIRRAVREEVPQKPSTFVSTMAVQRRSDLAQHRQTDSAKLVSQIRGDLDWIVMKALEKDRSRRYDTANGLALDIQRHLVFEPVLARPPSAGYRFSQYARRHKAALTAAAAVLAALFAGLVATTWMFFKEKDARERAAAAEHEQSRLRQLAEAAVQSQSEERTKAEIEADKSRQVAKFLGDMLAGVGPSVALGDDTKLLRKILDQTAERVGENLKNQPEVEAELRSIMGKIYSALGEYEKAEEMLTGALVISKKLRGEAHPEVVALLNEQATVLAHQGGLDRAEAILREALAMQKKVSGNDADVSTTLNNLAIILADRGNLTEAETVHREALAINKSFAGEESEAVALSLNNLAVVLEQLGKLDEAEKALREAIAVQRRLLANEHPDLATSLNSLANVVQKQNNLAESESLFREVLVLQRKLLGDAHPNVAAALNGLGLALHKQGRNPEAEPLLREGVEIERKARKGAHPETATLIGNLGRIMEDQEQYAEAESLFREALTICKSLPGNEHPNTASWRNRLKGVLKVQKKWADMEPMLREDLEVARRTAPPGEANEHLAGTLKDLGATLYNQKRAPDAEPFIREAVDIYRQLPGSTDPMLSVILGALGGVLEAQRKYPEAESIYREAREIIARKTQDGGSRFIGNWHSHLAGVLEKQGKYPEAETMRREALEAVRQSANPNPSRLEPSLYALSENLYRQDKYSEAEPLLHELIASMQTRYGKDSAQLLGPKSRLGRLLADWAWSERGQLSDIQNSKSQISDRAREAEQLLRECLKASLRASVRPQDSDEARSRIGGALSSAAITDPSLTSETRLAKFTEAEALLLESNEALQKNPEVDSKLKRDSLTRIVRLYEAWDKPAKAAGWRKKLAALEQRESETANTPGANAPNPEPETAP